MTMLLERLEGPAGGDLDVETLLLALSLTSDKGRIPTGRARREDDAVEKRAAEGVDGAVSNQTPFGRLLWQDSMLGQDSSPDLAEHGFGPQAPEVRGDARRHSA
mmetsp:Transcript_31443/g.99708  ORF Transcript_31443/g.99708 Transcript_31443/m.99708 type:complete len:104 (-) Transcript_31443:148-459(-)